MPPRTTTKSSTALYTLGAATLLGGVLLLPQPGSAPAAYAAPTAPATAPLAPAVELHLLPRPAPPTPAVTHPAPAPRPRPTLRAAVARHTSPKAAPKATHPPRTHRTAYTGAGSARAYALNRLGPTQYACIDAIFTRESGWSPTARNPSGAFGIPQALPGSKMSSAGADWATNGATQVAWGISYMDARYGSPCGAWQFWQTHQWY